MFIVFLVNLNLIYSIHFMTNIDNMHNTSLMMHGNDYYYYYVTQELILMQVSKQSLATQKLN